MLKFLLFLGYVCSHGDLGLNGCCIPDRNSTERFSCNTCQQNRCCKVYEYCVSCCLQPNKVIYFCFDHKSKTKNPQGKFLLCKVLQVDGSLPNERFVTPKIISNFKVICALVINGFPVQLEVGKFDQVLH